MLLIRFTPGHELVGLQVVAEDGLINNKEGCLGQVICLVDLIGLASVSGQILILLKLLFCQRKCFKLLSSRKT